MINGKIGKVPKKARGIKIRESIKRAGMVLKIFLIHKCLPLVIFLNQENM